MIEKQSTVGKGGKRSQYGSENIKVKKRWVKRGRKPGERRIDEKYRKADM